MQLKEVALPKITETPQSELTPSTAGRSLKGGVHSSTHPSDSGEIDNMVEVVSSKYDLSPETTSTRKNVHTTPGVRPRTRSQGAALKSDPEMLLSISKKRMVKSLLSDEDDAIGNSTKSASSKTKQNRKDGAAHSEQGLLVLSVKSSDMSATEKRVTRSQSAASTSGKK
jgi:hypothetical protein